MNKKKFISTVIFALIILFSTGFAYYFDSAQVEATPLADISVIDSASSSLPAPNPQEDTVAPSIPSTKQSAQKENSVVALVATVMHADTLQDPVVSSTENTVILPLTQSTSNITDDLPPPIPSTPSFLPSSQTSSPLCSFPDITRSSSRRIIFNEIAWMGSPSSSIAEWIELKNISTSDADLFGWKLTNISGKIKIIFVGGDTIAPGGLMLLSRGSENGGNDVSGQKKIYSGDLSNGGDTLALMDPQCAVSDYLDASNGWPAGNNTTKQTLERDADGVGWHTSALPGGTPAAENSAGSPPAQYKLNVAFEGNASGATITSEPAGLACGASCAGSFASGTKITLAPAAGADTAFERWSGSCYGETVCSFVIAANTSFTAQFRSTLPLPATTTAAEASSSIDNADNLSFTPGIVMSTGTSSSSAPASSSSVVVDGHILIAAVQIAGASSSNDLIKLYNPTASAIDMSGWKLHKKSKTGANYSLKAFSVGSTIGAGQSFVWANSIGGFSEAAGANVSSTETLSADNSVALMDAAGNIVDAVAWGTGTSQYGEGPPYPTSPGANQLLSRRSSGDVMVDTRNNTNDFTLQ